MPKWINRECGGCGFVHSQHPNDPRGDVGLCRACENIRSVDPLVLLTRRIQEFEEENEWIDYLGRWVREEFIRLKKKAGE